MVVFHARDIIPVLTNLSLLNLNYTGATSLIIRLLHAQPTHSELADITSHVIRVLILHNGKAFRCVEQVMQQMLNLMLVLILLSLQCDGISSGHADELALGVSQQMLELGIGRLVIDLWKGY